MIQKAADNFFYELNDDRKPTNVWDVNFQFYKRGDLEAFERFRQVKARFAVCDEMYAFLEYVLGDVALNDRREEELTGLLAKARGES